MVVKFIYLQIKNPAMDIEHIPETDEPIEDPNFYDFSVKDLESDKEIQKSRKLEAEFKKMMSESLRIVTDAFHAVESPYKNLKHFILHKALSVPFLCDSYQGKWGKKEFYFCSIKYTSTVQAGRVYNSGADYYFAGLIDLEKTYPHTVIQPETFALKIQNLFSKRDINFKYSKKFSRKFMVDTEDKEALQMLVFNKDLDRIATHPAAQIEFNGRQCYFRANLKPVSMEEAENFVDLAKILLEVL
jgi:hypothetical protein